MTEEENIERAKAIMMEYVRKLKAENNERFARYLEEIQETFLKEYAELAKTVKMINKVEKLDPKLYEGSKDKRKVGEINRILEREKKRLSSALDSARDIAKKYIEMGRLISEGNRAGNSRGLEISLRQKGRELNSASKRLTKRSNLVEKQHEKLSSLVAGQIPALSEFGKGSIADAYNKESKGNMFLKSFSFLTRKSRKSQIEKLQNAMDKFAEAMTNIAMLDPDKILIKPGEKGDAFDKITRDEPGKSALEDLKKDLADVMQEIEQEKKDSPYKLGESRLESICDRICSRIKCDKSMLLSQAKESPAIEPPSSEVRRTAPKQ